MKLRLLSRITALVLLAALAGPASALAAGTGNGQVPNNVAPWLADAKLVGHANPSGQATVSVYLKWRNEQGLADFLRNLYLPRTKEYRHFLTPQQFRAAYAPVASDVQAVKDFLAAKGLKVAYNPDNNLYVDATGSVAQLEKAFGVTENLYSYQGKTLRANAEAPTIPGALGGIVAFIGGLDESELLNEPYIRADRNAPPGGGYATPGPCSEFWGDQMATASPAPTPYPATLPWVICGYTPQQIRAAYGLYGTALTGQGVRVGIVDAFASPTIVEDVNRFSEHYDLPLLDASNFQQIAAPGIYNKPENPQYDPQGWYGEETLDVEWVHAIAPQATIVYAGGNNNRVPLDHALIHLIDNHLVDIVSNSWGYNGEIFNYGHIQANERAFMQAAAEGISVLFSSGDNGDVAAIRGVAMASYPASSPWVTAVGGTSLALTDASGAKQEYGWGTYLSTLGGSQISGGGTVVTGTSWSPWPPTFQYGSGGGVSLIFGQPSYQAGVVPSALSTKTTTLDGQTITFSRPHRVTPDISLVGDPNTGVLVGETYQVSGDPLIDAGCTPLDGGLEYCERRIGGTSLSSPLFAGVLALVDQARFDAGKGSLGFVNPSLYALGNGKAIADVQPPSTPTAVLRNTGATGQTTTLRTINSVPDSTGEQVIEGADTSLRTTPGYDNVTGLGTPNGLTFVNALIGP
jgi:subtilase family serine protease